MTTIKPLQMMTWATSVKLPSAPKHVLLVLCLHADKDMTCYPGQQRLVEQTGLSESTVRRAIKTLEDHSIIFREKRFRKDGTRTSDRFHINVGSQPVDNSSK